MKHPGDMAIGSGPLRVSFDCADLHGQAGIARVWEHPDGGVVIDVQASPVQVAPRVAKQIAEHLLAVLGLDRSLIDADGGSDPADSVEHDRVEAAATHNIRWQEAQGALHAYLLPARPRAVGDSFIALGHAEPVTITADDLDPQRKARRGPMPTCAACDIAARRRIGVSLCGYEEHDRERNAVIDMPGTELAADHGRTR